MTAYRSTMAFAIAAMGLLALAGETNPSAPAEPEVRPTAPVSVADAGASPRAALETEIRDAVESLRGADGDDAKQAAKGQLLASVSRYFDADLESRRRQVTEIESRLTKLQGELNRRLAGKSEVIHLQLKALDKDDAGLGLYSRDEMSRLLANYFDADMKSRQGELAEMETRAKRLHAQLDQRQAAREEIIQLQVNVLVNEAAGLGFYCESTARGL
jgi:hypothetical protein